LVYLVSGRRDLFSGTETGFYPCVPGFKDILQGFLWRISLTGTMLKVRNITYKT
jgi:hypothetical protein